MENQTFALFEINERQKIRFFCTAKSCILCNSVSVAQEHYLHTLVGSLRFQ